MKHLVPESTVSWDRLSENLLHILLSDLLSLKYNGDFKTPGFSV